MNFKEALLKKYSKTQCRKIVKRVCTLVIFGYCRADALQICRI